MKFIKCMYTSFDNKVLDVKWNKGDVIALTKKLAKSPVIMDGLNTRNFVFHEVSNLTELSKVVNLTKAIEKEFKEALAEARKAREEAAKAAEEAAKPKTHPAPEDKGVKPTPPPEPEAPKEEEKPPTEEPPKEDEKTEEKQPAEGDGDSAEDKTEEPKEEEKVLAFTEMVGNVGAAVTAVEGCGKDDIEKLKVALKLDERVTVQKAVKDRLAELEAGE